MQIERTPANIELAKRILATRLFLRFVTYLNSWFKVSWHHEMIAEALERVERGELKRLMVFLPPRHSKSEMVSIHFPAWFLGRNKDKSIIQASYSAELAMEFGRQARNIVDSKEYKNLFTTTLAEDSQSKSVWSTNGRGRYNAVGVGGSATGKGADVLIIDDPIKNRKDADSFLIRENIYKWYQSTARTRLSPDGAVILVVTRWHDDDLAGRLLSEETAKDWEVISLPAIAEEDELHRKKGEALWEGQFNLQNLLKTKQEVGSYEWSSLYQQNPLNAETQEFHKSLYKYITIQEVNKLQTATYITIDPAVKETDNADYTGIIINKVDTNNNWYIKAIRKKFDSAKLLDYIFELWNLERPECIGIEETTFTEAIYPFLKYKMLDTNIFPNIVALKHHGTNKELRIRGLLPRYEAKKIFHILDECDYLEEEEMRFPKGKNDDLVDALAYQEQVAMAPEVPRTYIQQAREDMQVDDRTGYFR